MGGPNYDKLRESREGGGRARGFKAKGGDNHVRILPPNSAVLENWEAMDAVFFKCKVHWLKLEGRKTEKTRCLEDLKLRCPACEVWRSNRKSGDPQIAQLAKDLAPRDEYLCNMLDLDNLQAGIQRWAANYTCWNDIMDIVCDAQWGNVVDPACGTDFTVTMVPADKSRKGHNEYSAKPQREQTTVIEILESLGDWRAMLDELKDNLPEAMEAEAIELIIDDIGFPRRGPQPDRAEPAAERVSPRPAAASPAARPAAAAAPKAAPAAARPAPAAAVARPAAAGAPRPAAARPAAARGIAAPPASRPAPAQEDAGVQEEGGGSSEPGGSHPEGYDPGPDFTPKLADDERPENAPRCFGGYDPAVHRCAPCPFIADCQMELIGIKTSRGKA